MAYRTIEEYSSDKPYCGLSTGRKALIFIIIMFTASLSTLTDSEHTTIEDGMGHEFNVTASKIHNTKYVFLSVSAVSALVWGHLSDVYGRRYIYLVSLSMLFAANTLLTLLPADIRIFYGLKALQAIGSSSVFCVGIGTLVDITRDCRWVLVALFMTSRALGSIIGRIMFATLNDQWRWGYGILSLLSGLSVLWISLFVPETLRSLVGSSEYFAASSTWTKFRLLQQRVIPDEEVPKQRQVHLDIYIRLVRIVPVTISSVAEGLMYFLFYGNCISFGPILVDAYEYSAVQSSLAYIAPGIGLVVLAFIAAAIDNESSNSRPTNPNEDNRFFSPMFIGSFSLIGGVIAYAVMCYSDDVVKGYVDPYSRGHNDDILGGYFGIVFFSFAWSTVVTVNTLFLTDAVQQFPASAIALSGFVRSLFALVVSVIVDTAPDGETLGAWFLGIGIPMIFANFIFYLVLLEKTRDLVEESTNLIEF